MNVYIVNPVLFKSHLLALIYCFIVNMSFIYFLLQLPGLHQTPITPHVKNKTSEKHITIKLAKKKESTVYYLLNLIKIISISLCIWCFCGPCIARGFASVKEIHGGYIAATTCQ